MSALDEWLLGKSKLPEFVDDAEATIEKAIELVTDLTALDQQIRTFEEGHQVRPDQRFALLASDLKRALTRLRHLDRQSLRRHSAPIIPMAAARRLCNRHGLLPWRRRPGGRAWAGAGATAARVEDLPG